MIEILAALMVLVLAQILVVPAFGAMVSTMRLNSSAEAIYTSLLLARSEAVKRNARVIICKSGSGSACAPAAEWHQGWIIFHDANSNGARDDEEPILYQEAPLPKQLRLTGNGPVRDYVSYTAVGRTSLVSGAFQAGTFTVCELSGKQTDARQVVINSSGRPRQAKTTVEYCQ